MNNQERAGLTNEGYNLQKGYINRRDGEMYFLKLVTRPGVDGKDCTIFQLKNILHYWEGTEAQFKAAFQT